MMQKISAAAPISNERVRQPRSSPASSAGIAKERVLAAAGIYFAPPVESRARAAGGTSFIEAFWLNCSTRS